MGPINAIGQDPLGIGYSVYYYAVFIFPNEDVKLLGVEGVVPCFVLRDRLSCTYGE